MSGRQGIRVNIMELNSDIKPSRNILSQDQYFILGLTELLGTNFLEAFYQVIDLDCNDIKECKDALASDKKAVAFASSDLAYYNSEIYKDIAVLDKKSSLKEIISFFARDDTLGNYHTKFNLTHREKQMLNLLRKGESNKEIALKLGIKPKTIYSHRRNLMMKLGCENRIMFHKLFLKNPAYCN